ncbi:MAG: endonuclease/exonuclease/phosphatase family protein [Acidimicrobiia bacterium]|nr:endonuclease/exonuclease/phosphatase family protein [Acidimicrobiia bacterium]
MRILTANVLHVHADPAAFGATLDRERPDVVALQELGTAVAAEVRSRYDHVLLDATDDPRGMGIASAAPATFERLPLPHTDGWRAMVDGGPEVLSVHVHNPVDVPPVEANRHRRAQVAALVAHVGATTHPMVIAGDLNATPAWPAYRRLTAHLDDAVVQAVGARAAAGLRTWGPRILRGTKILRIDHVLVRAFEGRTARVVPIAGSDHAAVVVDLEAS